MDISALANANLRHWYTNGVNYPVAPTTLAVGGVDFSLSPLPGVSNSLGIIELRGRNIYTRVVNIAGATEVYTLINSAWGRGEAINGTIEFIGSGGSFATFDLKQGWNIRDHLNGRFNNTVLDLTVATVNFPGNLRLDRQKFVLPVSFATETLTAITFRASSSGAPNGRAFVAGMTVATVRSDAVPEPSTVFSFVLPLLSVVLAGLYRRTFEHAI